jgi:hypothetical protein
VSQDTLAVAAAQSIQETAPTVGGHKDEIGVSLARRFKDHFDDVALFRHLMPGPAGDLRRNNGLHRPVLAHMEQSEFTAFTF